MHSIVKNIRPIGNEVHTIVIDQHNNLKLSSEVHSSVSSGNCVEIKKVSKYNHYHNQSSLLLPPSPLQEEHLPRIQMSKKTQASSTIQSVNTTPSTSQILHFRVIKDGRLYEEQHQSQHRSDQVSFDKLNTVVSSSLSSVTCVKNSNSDISEYHSPTMQQQQQQQQMRPPPPKIKIINNEEPSSSIPDLEFDGTTVLCRVCGDKASGFHYGVHSCEGCKGFFRRSIQQKIQYRPCTKNQQCSILRINRNRCQYCRLKKCIAVGMSRDAVRFGRVPKREKARILAAMQQSTQNRGQQRALASELDDQPRLLAAVLRAHMETCEFTRDKVNSMRQRARECPNYSMPTLACPLNPAPEIQSEQEFSQRFAHVIRGVIDFAGMIPGFQLLTQDDKFTLLKAGLFDALFVRLICMFDTSINSIICLNGQLMRRDSIQNGANARFLVDSTFNFAERMNSMQLTDAEIGLFCAIVLITPDRPGLRNVELIEKMYKKLKMCLQTVIQQNRPDKPEFLNDLLNTMPDLRTLSTLHTEKLVVFRTEHKELLRQQNMWNGTNPNFSGGSASSTASSSIVDDMETSSSKSPSPLVPNWSNELRNIPEQMSSPSCFDELAKSPMGSVSSTESNDTGIGTIDYAHYPRVPAESANHSSHRYNHQSIIIGVSSGSNSHQFQPQQTSSITSSAPLLAATLSGANCCPMRAQSSVLSLTTTPNYNPHRISNSSAEDDLVNGSGASTAPSTTTATPPSTISAPPAAAVHLVQNGLTITPVLRQIPATTTTPQTNAPTTTQIRYRKLDSPTDSGIESGNEKQNEHSLKSAAGGVTTIVQSNNCNSNSSGSSSCSSPRSSVDENMLEHHQIVSHHHSHPHLNLYQQQQRQQNRIQQAQTPPQSQQTTIDDMPVLKRVLQAPPLYDTNSLMDEAYKPHKKFRAMRHHNSTPTRHDSTEFMVQKGDSSGMTSPSPPAPAQPNGTNTTTIILNNNGQQQQQSPPHLNHQSQLHMHLTRTQTNTTSTSNNNNTNSSNNSSNNSNNSNSSTSSALLSSLSSTHSVLAKSLMEEPRMTPEQIKRSDIIQNYIMRGEKHHSMYNKPNMQKWPAPQQQGQSPQQAPSPQQPQQGEHYGVITTTLPPHGSPNSITTTKLCVASPSSVSVTPSTIKQEQRFVNYNQSLSPSSTQNFSGAEMSPRAPSTGPRVIELKVDIAENANQEEMLASQPLNLSKKSAAQTTVSLLSPTSPSSSSTPTPNSLPQSKLVQSIDEQQPKQPLHKILLEA